MSYIYKIYENSLPKGQNTLPEGTKTKFQNQKLKNKKIFQDALPRRPQLGLGWGGGLSLQLFCGSECYNIIIL